MPQINIGTIANDGTGDPLRTAFQRVDQYGFLNDKTVNAAFYKTASITTEAALNLAIPAAALLGTGAAVWIPASMLSYNASLVTFNTAVRMLREGGIPTTYDIRAYGAAGDFIQDDTAAINAAIAGAIVNGDPVLITPGTYRLVPATASTDAAGVITVAIPIKSNMNVVGLPGATFKLANGQSTDGAPKSLGMFFSNAATNNWSIRGLVMDMNGANNTISPSRPGTYQQSFNMAQISVSGDAANGTDVVIEYNQFINSPGTNEIVAGQSNTPGVPLGKRWIVAHNLFKNNGTDCNDSSALYGWTEDMDVHDNIFWEDNPPGTVGKTGNKTAHEIHGTNGSFHDNLIHNYMRGCYSGGNLTNPVYNTDIHDNVMEVTAFGVALSRSGSMLAISQVKIHNNTIRLIENPFTGGPAAQIGIDYSAPTSVNNVEIEHNHFEKSGGQTQAATAVIVVPSTGQPYANVRISHNTVLNMSGGVQLRTDTAGGSLGLVEVEDNEFVNFSTLGGSSPIGIYVVATNTIATLVVDQNRFIDTGGATFQKGITLTVGTITDSYIGPQVFKGLTTANYEETGGIVLTNRLPLFGYGLQAFPSTNLLLKSNDGVTRATVGTGGITLADRLLSTETAGTGTLVNTTATTNQKFVQLNNTSGSVYFGVESSVGGGFFTGTTAYESVIYTPGKNLFISTPAVRLTGALQLGTPALAVQAGQIFQGSGVPSNTNGNNGDIYFRTDTPGTANQRMYIKSVGAWVALTL